jgi:glycosyltransferase involved in cell wall biosynthesis
MEAELLLVTQELRQEQSSRTDRHLKICLATDSLEPSGVGEHMLGLAEALRNTGGISFVCSPSPTGKICLERAMRLGLDTLALDWRRPRASELFREWLSARQVDICHIHAGIVWEGLDVVAAARGAGVPVVIRTEHLPYLLDGDEHARYADVLRHVDKIVCVSHEARKSFVAAGIPAGLIKAIRNGIAVPSTRHGHDRVRALLGLNAPARVVLTVARFTEQKDYHGLLDAVPAVIAREPRALFVWVGIGPLENAMHKAVHERGLDQHVVFLGQRSDVPDLMAAADLFVLPSRFEGLPLVVLEAMAFGLPVIGTRVCGTAEVVQDRITGLLVRPSDSKGLADAISELLTNPQWAAQLGVRGRMRARRAFSSNRMVREILALYHDLLSQSQRARRSGAESCCVIQEAGAST